MLFENALCLWARMLLWSVSVLLFAVFAVFASKVKALPAVVNTLTALWSVALLLALGATRQSRRWHALQQWPAAMLQAKPESA